ncbi:DNA-entry nuclease [Paenibacillus brevis]|uniref:DNA-entry nuclease n=1 Tax=Paenibacillus brevis TaxID=2841508 RepID=A0ABS6FU50_9BACL|nr:DNA-entry nuclease [Paenibacillus brevis]MBU5672675.1 DNA-entry nuclease [Paenibacillus brevis]
MACVKVEDGIAYNGLGMMLYDPEFHPNHGERFTEDELSYLCKFYKHDGRRSMSFALGKTERVVQNKYCDLLKKGLVDYYKSLDHYV